MASVSTHLITDHDSRGKSTVTDVVEESSNPIEMPFGTMECLYSNSGILPDVMDASDLEETKQTRANGLSGGRVTIDNGLAVALVSFKPGQGSPMHRTRTLDLGVVLEGKAEVEFDDGLRRRLKSGDTIVQRGTIHKWRNVSPADGWLRMYFVSLDAKPMVIDGKELQEEWLPEPGAADLKE